jgi:hypothetical protein
MNEILNEVKGRRLPLDQPSHTTDTFDWMCYTLVNKVETYYNSTYVDEINCYAFKIGHFAVNGSCNGSFLRDICVTEFGIEIGYETPKGRAFDKAKRLEIYQSMLSSERGRREDILNHKSQ